MSFMTRKLSSVVFTNTFENFGVVYEIILNKECLLEI